MKDLVLKNGKVTSLNIAEFTGKHHNDLMKAIRLMEPAWVEIGQGNFAQSSYLNLQNREMPMYELTKTEFLYIASKFNDDLRAKIILRWEQLEQQSKPSLDFNDPDTVLQLAQNWKDEKQKRLLAEAKIQENAPKVVFADSVMGSSNSVLVRDFAKMLSDEDFKIGQNRLFSWFRDNGYLMKDNMPYQNFVERGYFEVIERTIGSGHETFTSKTTKITGAGQVYFAKKIRNNEDLAA